jgi:hypothetical protein
LGFGIDIYEPFGGWKFEVGIFPGQNYPALPAASTATRLTVPEKLYTLKYIIKSLEG